MRYEPTYEQLEGSFQSDLLPNEHIMWTGRPKTSVILHREDLFVIPFSILWGGFTIFWEASALSLFGFRTAPARHPATLFMAVWGIPFVLIGQYMIWGRFIFDIYKKKRTVYAVTDQRVLILTTGPMKNFTAAFLEALPAIQKNTRSNGVGTLTFGYSPPPYRIFDANRRQRGGQLPVFQDIENADSVYEMATRARAERQKTLSQ